MARSTELDRQWQALMSLCAREAEYKSERRHPRLLRFITEQINQLATEMGFTERQIRTREFRSEKHGDRVVRIIIE
jgi:hypothetical protein